MRRLIVAAAALLSTSALHAAPVTYVAPLALARNLPPVGQVTATFDSTAETLRFVVATGAGALDAGEHQLHLHANYAGNLLIGQTITQQVKALPPATTDDLDGDGVIEVFEAVPLIGESWWTIATAIVGADGRLNYDSGILSTASAQLFAPDALTIGSPGVSGADDIDFPFDIDNIGFFRSSLDNFGLLAFDIHGALDAAGIGATPGEIDGSDGFEPLKPAIGGAFAAAGAVPEPTTWAMLIGGFGLIGVMQRRRRPVLQ